MASSGGVSDRAGDRSSYHNRYSRRQPTTGTSLENSTSEAMDYKKVGAGLVVYHNVQELNIGVLCEQWRSCKLKLTHYTCSLHMISNMKTGFLLTAYIIGFINYSLTINISYVSFPVSL